MSALKEAVKIATDLCIEFEGLRKAPYLCPAGVPTIGYGSTYYKDGRRVKLTDPPISEKEARDLLEYTLVNEFLMGVLKASPLLINHPSALGALSSFAYNLGVPRYRASTLRKRVEERDWEGAREEILLWRKSGGKILPGLERRRRAEAVYLRP